jgi:hypothetical protein
MEGMSSLVYKIQFGGTVMIIFLISVSDVPYHSENIE